MHTLFAVLSGLLIGIGLAKFYHTIYWYQP